MIWWWWCKGCCCNTKPVKLIYWWQVDLLMKLSIRYLWSVDDDVEVVAATPNQSSWSIVDKLIFFESEEVDVCDLMTMMLRWCWGRCCNTKPVELIYFWQVDLLMTFVFASLFWADPDLETKLETQTKLRKSYRPNWANCFWQIQGFLRALRWFYCFVWQNKTHLSLFLLHFSFHLILLLSRSLRVILALRSPRFGWD